MVVRRTCLEVLEQTILIGNLYSTYVVLIFIVIIITNKTFGNKIYDYVNIKITKLSTMKIWSNTV